MRDWIIEKMEKNISFPNLPEKTQFTLVGLISKELQGILEVKGSEFLAAYQAVLGPILERVNWIYVKNPQFVWKRWNGIKLKVAEILRGNDKLTKVPVEVVAVQAGAVQKIVNAFVNGHQINSPRPEKEWVKNPKGGWMRNPRALEG